MCFLVSSGDSAKSQDYDENRLWQMIGALLLLAGVLCTNADAARGLQDIEICTVEWRPYTSASMEGDGFAAQMATAVFNNIGYSPRFVFTSTPTCEDNASKNERNSGIRGALPYFQSRKREDRGLSFSQAMFDVQEVIFYSKVKYPELLEFEKSTGLSGYTAAFVQGYAYSEVVQDLLTNRKPMNNEIEAFRNLLDGQVDLVPADHTVGLEILRTYFARRQFEIGVLPGIRARRGVHFMVSERNPHNRELLDRFDESLQTIKKSGDFEYRIRAIQEDHRQLVRLVDDSHVFVRGRDIDHPDKGYLLPRGTVAEVEKWARALVRPHGWPPPTELDECTTVRITNGPHRGRILCVDSAHILITPD